MEGRLHKLGKGVRIFFCGTRGDGGLQKLLTGKYIVKNYQPFLGRQGGGGIEHES